MNRERVHIGTSMYTRSARLDLHLCINFYNYMYISILYFTFTQLCRVKFYQYCVYLMYTYARISAHRYWLVLSMSDQMMSSNKRKQRQQTLRVWTAECVLWPILHCYSVQVMREYYVYNVFSHTSELIYIFYDVKLLICYTSMDYIHIYPSNSITLRAKTILEKA